MRQAGVPGANPRASKPRLNAAKQNMMHTGMLASIHVRLFLGRRKGW